MCRQGFEDGVLMVVPTLCVQGQLGNASAAPASTDCCLSAHGLTSSSLLQGLYTYRNTTETNYMNINPAAVKDVVKSSLWELGNRFVYAGV
jgi:hypothetical protein